MSFLIVLAVILFGWGSADAALWSIDSDRSAIQFEIQNRVLADVQGTFDGVRGKVLLDDENLTGSKIELVIPARSLRTDAVIWERLLRGPGYLDTERFSALTFVSKGIHRDETGTLRVYGDLSLRGVTREIGVEVHSLGAADHDPGGTARRSALASARINRKDFGIAWGGFLDNGGLLVGEEIEITMNLELVRRRDAAEKAAVQTLAEGTAQASFRKRPPCCDGPGVCCGKTRASGGSAEE